MKIDKMATNNQLAELAKCLTQAGEIVKELTGTSASTSSAERPATSSANANTRTQTRIGAAISSVHQTVNRAQSMLTNSTNRGTFSRLNGRERLRAISGTGNSGPPSKKAKPVEKTYEFILIDSRGQLNSVNDSFVLEDGAIVSRGIVTLNSTMSEQDIRACLQSTIVLKFPTVLPQDLVFLKAVRRKITRPINAGEFSFKEVKLLAGQGCIYVTLKEGFECLLDDYFEDSSKEGSSNEDKEVDDNDPVKTDVDGKEDKNDDLLTHEEENDLFTPEDTELLKSALGSKNDIEVAVSECYKECQAGQVTDPVEVLKCAQKHILKGRPLDTISVQSNLEGEVTQIDVNRHNLLKTAFDEIEHIANYQLTLQVNFYGEIAFDHGGPRKEFFSLCLREIKQKYFDNGLRTLLAADYEKIGIIMSLSILQNGPIPRFLEESMLEELFESPNPSPCMTHLRDGFAKVGIYQIVKAIPQFVYLMRPSDAYELTRRKLLFLLKPSFSEEGSNAKHNEMAVYELFLKYVREASSGRRAPITLGNILRFVTGAEEEPVLGFAIPPSISFTCATNKSKWSFLPTSNTCSQMLKLPTGSHSYPLPPEDVLFEVYDSAFSNEYFGLA